jgi:hypothetical protein
LGTAVVSRGQEARDHGGEEAEQHLVDVPAAGEGAAMHEAAEPQRHGERRPARAQQEERAEAEAEQGWAVVGSGRGGSHGEIISPGDGSAS